MIRSRVGALSLLLLVGMGACMTRPVTREPLPHSFAGVTPETILASINQRWQTVEELRALVRTTITSTQGRYSTRQTFLWHRPASVRLDTLSLLGQPTMTLVADPAGASIYYPQQGKFFQGPATATTFARVIGLPLNVEDVAPLLVGSLQLSPTHKVATMHLQSDAGMYLLRFLGAGGQLIQDVWVDPDQMLPQRAIRYTPGNVPAVDIAYSDFRPIGDHVLFPFELVIWVPHIETEVRLQFLTVDRNPGLPPTVFQLSPPAGVQVAPLE
jgi:outer membrane lipoprotein-sorting protein